MTLCELPSDAAPVAGTAAAGSIQAAQELLARAGVAVPLALQPEVGAHAAKAGEVQDPVDRYATGLMDLFRSTGMPEAFELLVRLTHPHLLRRAKRRCRSLGGILDPNEVVQDTFVNVYRYPDRFEARRPAAFRIWSATILDNVVRRGLRGRRQRLPMRTCTSEDLSREADPQAVEPQAAAIAGEDSRQTELAWQLFLHFYLQAFLALGDRERHVLQKVEVQGLRYHQLAGELGIRPEALKMVVFRARRRLFERMRLLVPSGESSGVEPGLES